jgi:subfamily B ATP-binding cassette protein MsbA
MSDSKVIKAAKASNSYSFIEELTDKLDTDIGQNGAKLSGGQRQRLAIARAIAKDSPILILDEATSSLDSDTEKQVQKALDNMQKDRTTIVIAHRLSTVQNADRIIVLESGKIVEQGKHLELIELKGVYANLYNQQFDV